MKNELLIILLVTVLSILSAVEGYSQAEVDPNKGFDKLTPSVELNKAEYFPLEPIYAHIALTNNTSGPVRIAFLPPNSSIFLTVRQGDNVRVSRNLLFLREHGTGFGKEILPLESVKYDLVLEMHLELLFPEPGVYQIEFGLLLQAEKAIHFKPIEILIKIPEGITRSAVEFLRQNQIGVLFWWKDWENGEVLLEQFVRDYSETVWGDAAKLKLAKGYMERGSYSAARDLLQRLTKSENKTIASESKNHLVSIEGLRDAKKRP